MRIYIYMEMGSIKRKWGNFILKECSEKENKNKKNKNGSILAQLST